MIKLVSFYPAGVLILSWLLLLPVFSEVLVEMKKIKIGVVSFTDPRPVKGIKEINAANLAYQDELVRFLKKAGFECVVPLKDRCVDGRAASEEVIRKFSAGDVDCMAFGCWKWTDPNPARLRGYPPYKSRRKNSSDRIELRSGVGVLRGAGRKDC